MGESGEGIYKHSAGENWASDIGRLRAWDWNGNIVVAPTTYPVTPVGHITVLGMYV
jgi:hypothetical protein